MSDETTDPGTPPARKKGVRTMIGEASAEAVAEERRWAGVESKLDEALALLGDLNDEKALAFAKQEARTRRTEACVKIAVNLVQPAAMKYYAGIVAMVVAGYMGLSLSGYGVTVGAGDCPTVEAGAVPSDAP